ncbi:NACHT, LRR and PYD domains-containing protein 12-like [Exaiptasia diaphana]|uniref:NACHT domain-containing protein n=1 Tax=Exaiptasia diaphana TaxID=2652724 RepID=A0A913XP58_EXADI|nr:NACHT, LRR and PYD domains-containing protein 12-like [Exaiptasia diaphana]XP_020907489.1 NACHT, LRR and PYD domains-containing protein 12-like [Exaiptasia diaphana]
MATGWSTITKENTNFARLCKLLIDGGTHALRVIFDAKYPPHDLKKHLMDSRIHNILKNLKAKKLLRPEQWNRLYPSVGMATSTGFDITLLSLLLRNICNLPTPVKGWNEEPATGSVNVEDDVVRLRLYRNNLYGHISEPALSDADFNKYWKKIEIVLLRHGVNKTSIDSLKSQSFDQEDEDYYIKCLKEWITDEADRVIHEVKESEKRVLEKVDNVEQKLDQLSPERPSSRPITSKDVELYSEKLKEAIITQTDDLQPKGIIHAPMKTDDIFTNLVVHGKERCPEQIQSGQNPVGRTTLTEIKHCSEIFVHKDENLSFLQTLWEKIRMVKKKNPKRIIVSGEPGIGKTLFSQQLVRDLAKDSISIPDVKYTYMIPFRLLNSLDKDLSLQELLNLSPLLNEATMIDDALMEYFSQHSEKLFIVLDGFDEYKNRGKILTDDEGPNDSKAKMPVTALVSKLIQKRILSDSVIMVTSRPGEADELDQKIHFDRYVEILGFSEQQVIEFVEKYFRTKPEEVKNTALSKVKESAHYILFGRVPFRCLLMCVFIEWKIKKHDNSCPLTLTEFYFQVIQCIEKNYNRAILSLDDKAALLAVDKTLDNFSKLAAQLSKENRFSFTLQDLENLKVSENEILCIKSSSLIFCYPVSSNNSPFQKPIWEYSFTHSTIQEFFFARYLVKKGVMAAHRTTEMVYTFMSGLLGLSNNSKLMLELLESLDKHIENASFKYRLRLMSLRCLHEFGEEKRLTRQELTKNRGDRYWNSVGRIALDGVSDTDCGGAITMLIESAATSSIPSSPYRLYIFDSSITSIGLKSLLSCLISHPKCTITALSLSGCSMNDENVKCLCKYLPKTKIDRLYLNSNKITDVGLDYIMEHFPSNLIRLELYGNEISSKCIEGTRQFCRDKYPRLMLYID